MTAALLLVAVLPGLAAQDAPPPVAEPDRLALTPTIDGALQDQEWDPFVNLEGQTWGLQWEPGILFIGGKLPATQQLVLSLDLRNDGWLVGKDNLEVAIGLSQGAPKVVARFLDATQPSGPVWLPAPDFESAAFASARTEGDQIAMEIALVDPATNLLPARDGQRFGARLDARPADAMEVQAFLPRPMSSLRSVYERGSNLPGGLRWRPQQEDRTAGPGSSLFVRFTFNGTNDLGVSRLDLSAFAVDGTKFGSRGTPFPRFDNKGRAFVDYSTPIPTDVSPGYRALQGILSDERGQKAILMASFRVAALVEGDLVLPDRMRPSENIRKVRMPLRMITRSPRVLRGNYNLRVPEGWSIEEGGDRDFTLSGTGAVARRVPQLVIPAGAKGVFPIRFNAEVDGKLYGKTYWLRIE